MASVRRWRSSAALGDGVAVESFEGFGMVGFRREWLIGGRAFTARLDFDLCKKP
jgi:hypothetical protein